MSAPSAEIWTKRLTPAACASRASRAGALDVHGIEALAAVLGKDADAADYRIGAGERRREPRLVIEAGIDERDLADIAHGRKKPASRAWRLTTATTVALRRQAAGRCSVR